MPRIGIVIPTLRDRLDLYERAVAAYRETTPGAVIATVRDRPSVGQAWDEGAIALLARGDCEFLHLGADDVLPHEGWWEAAVQSTTEYAYPAPRIVTEAGAEFAHGSLGGGMIPKDGADGMIVVNSQFPFFSADLAEAILPSLPIHYYADDWLAHRSRQIGLTARYVEAYALTHLEGTAGRGRQVVRSARDFDHFMRAVMLASFLDIEEAWHHVQETPSDWSEHLGVLHGLVDAAGTPTVIELGVRGGVSTVAILHALAPRGGRLWSCDVAGHYAPPACDATGAWTFVRGNDLDTAVVEQAPEACHVLVVDTTHRVDHTRAELALYGPRVLPGGAIVLHDANVPGVRAAALAWAAHIGADAPTFLPAMPGLAIIQRPPLERRVRREPQALNVQPAPWQDDA